MKFKEPGYQAQFNQLPKKLQEICYYFADLSQQMGIEAVVTRVFDAVPGDSGVHELHRAVDFRDQFTNEHAEVVSLYTPEDVNYITAEINNKYPRDDGRLVCIHHSFQGKPFHFHVQIGANWIDS